MTGRLDRDVDVDEEDELRRLNGQPAWRDREAHTGARAQHATHSPEGVSARGASSPADSAEGDGEEAEEGPSPMGSGGAEGGEAEAGGNADGDTHTEGDEEQLNSHRPGPCPEPPVYDSSRTHILEQTAASIQQHIKSRNGTKTYKTTWVLYTAWHERRYGRAPPTCPYTQLLWLDVSVASDFVCWMGNSKKTASQVHRRRFEPPVCKLLTLLPLCYPALPTQIKSARSALNFLLQQAHTLAVAADPTTTAPTCAKLSTKDAVCTGSSHPCYTG